MLEFVFELEENEFFPLDPRESEVEVLSLLA